MITCEHDFQMEKRLRALDPELHRRFTNTVFVLQHGLSHYRRLFPEYTDHSELHSMTVVDFCNQLIGREQIKMLNADEIYVLLMGCYLHDIGMGISEKDYEQFKESFDHKSYFSAHPGAEIADYVRDYHNEFSGLYIRKYAQLLEIPSEEHLFCIVQIARGHRRTNLFDTEEYPAAYPLPNGNTVCLPYLAALIRLADEIDVAADRNPILLYDITLLTDEVQIYHSRILAAVPKLHTSEDLFLMDVQTDAVEIYEGIRIMCKKMQATLDYCSTAVAERTPYRISQTRVDIRRI